MNTIANPYVGPRTFQENERNRFFGRKREARDLLAMVISEQLVLFYAQSGAGKSSLVNTCLIPDLKAKGFYVLTGRVGGDSPPGSAVENIYVFNLLRSMAADDITSDVEASKTIPQFFAKYKNDLAAANMEDEHGLRPHALIIDQFEEIFSTHHEAWDKREAFFQQLADAMETDPYLWIILVMREDFIASLDPYAPLLPSRLRRRYYMQRLERSAALEAINNPVKHLRPYAHGVAEKLVDDLCSIRVYAPDGILNIQPGQYVEPVQLQVICYNLWENLPSEGTQITQKDLQDVGDVNTSLGNYYSGRVKAVAEAKQVRERRIREWFTDKLISPGGIRNMVLHEPSGKSSGLENDIIQALPDLIRAEQRGGATFYELTHDRLVEPVIASNKRWEEEHASPLQKQASLWNDHAREESWLITDQALVEVEEWAQAHRDEITPVENEFLEACQKLRMQIRERQESQRQQLEIANKLAEEQRRSAQRARRFNVIAVSLAVISLILAGFAVWGTRQASIAEKEAQKQRATALTLADTARARELASLAEEKLDENLDLSILLGLESYDITMDNPDVQSTEAQNAMFEAIQRSARLRGYLAHSHQPIDQFRFSPDGKFVAALRKNAETTELVLWDIEGRVEPGLILADGAISEFSFSPDSSYLVARNRDGFSIWNVNTRTELRRNINGHIGEVSQVVFHPEGQTFASLGENGDVILWDLKEATKKYALPPGNITAFSPDGMKFAMFDRLGNITVGDVSLTNTETITIEQEPDAVTSMAFSYDGNLLAIATKDGNISVWDLVNNKAAGISFSPLPNPNIQAMAFQPDGNLMVFNLFDGVYIFDRNTGKPIGDPILTPAALFSPHGKTFVSWDQNEITLYDAASRERIGDKSFPGQRSVFSADDNLLAIFNPEDHRVLLVNPETGEPVGEAFPRLTGSVVIMAFSQDSKLLAIGMDDGSLSIWEVNSRRIRQSDSSQDSPASTLAFSQNGNTLIAGRRDGSLDVWDLINNKLERRVTDYQGRISFVNLSPDGQFLYSVAKDGVSLLDMGTLIPVGPIIAGDSVIFLTDSPILVIPNYLDGEVTLWNIATHEQITKIEASYQQLSPKQTILVTRDKEGKNALWSTLTGAALPATAGENTYVSISPNDQFLYTLDSVGSIISSLQEIATGTTYDVLNGERFIAFSPDDKILVTSSTAGEIQLRDPRTGDPLLEEPIQAENVRFSPDGKYMLAYSIYQGTSTTMWDIDRLETIHEELPRLTRDPIISADGSTVALVSATGIYLGDVKTGTITEPAIQGEFVGFSRDGKLLAVNFNSTLNLWNVTKKEMIGNPISGAFVDFSPDDTFAVIRDYSANNDLKFLDTTNGNQIGSPVRGQSGLVGNVLFNPVGTVQAVRGEDGRIAIDGGYTPYAPSYLEPQATPQATDTVIFSPDAKKLAIFGEDGSLALWDVFGSVLPEHTIEKFSSPVRNPVLSSDEKILAFSSENTLTLWNTGSHTLIGTLPKNHVKEALDVFLSQDGKRAVVNNNDGSLSLWDTETRQQIGDPIREAFSSFSPNGQILVTTQFSNYNSFALWDTSTGTPIGDRVVGNAPIFSRDGRFIAIQTYTGNDFNIFTRGSNEHRNELVPIGEPIQGAFQAFGLNGKVFISYKYSGTSYEYQLRETEAKEQTGVTVPGALWSVPSLSMSSDAKYALFYTSQYSPETMISSYTFYLWDLEKREQIGKPIEGVSYPAVSSNSLFLAAAVDNGQFKIWDLEKGTSSKEIPGTQISFSPDNKYFLGTDRTGTTIVWNTAGEKIAGPFEGSFWGFVGKDSRQIIFRSYQERGFFLYDVPGDPRTEETRIPGDGILFSPDGQLFASYYDRGGITLWRTATVTPIKENIPGRPLSFGADGEVLVATRTSDNVTELYIWKTSGDMEEPLDKFVYPGVLSPNGGIRLSENADKLVLFGSEGSFVWDLDDPAEKKALQVLTGAADRIVFSRDNRSLATVGKDGVILWDLAQRKQIGKTLKSQTGYVTDVAFRADGQLLVYLDSKGSIFKVNLSEGSQAEGNLNPVEKFAGACRMVLSPDGSKLAYKNGKNMFIWDVEKEIELAQWEENISCNGLVTFSENSRTLAYSEGNRVYLYSVGETGESSKRTELTGLSFFNFASDLTFVQDDVLLAVNTDDGRILFWDVAGHGLLGTMNQAGQVERVTNGKIQIYIPSENRLMLMDFTKDAWRVLLKKWRSDLCAKVGRNLTSAEFLQYFSDREFKEYHGTCPAILSSP